MIMIMLMMEMKAGEYVSTQEIQMQLVLGID